MALLLAKGEEFASWRGVEEFAVTYRDAAVRLASQRHPGGIVQLLELLEGLLEGVAQENTQVAGTVQQLIEELQQATEQTQLRALHNSFYDTAYRHFDRFGSPSAFFTFVSSFLHTFALRCLQLAEQQFEEALPPLALVVMGPAGRHEASRFARLQLGLVWDDSALTDELLRQLAGELVAWFRVCGLALEEHVSPLREEWQGSLTQWHQRFEEATRKEDREALIELLRLADRTVLVSQGDVGQRFEQLCEQYLSKRPFVGNLVERCTALSNGIGLMGHLKLEKSGPHRGAFPLLDHALLPLAATVSAICLMRGITAAGTAGRLRELVRNGKLDVDLAERALQAWHCFNEHRLALERQAAAGQDCRDILHLVPSTLSHDELERIRDGLEAVSDLQRFMQVCFGAYA